MKYILGNVYLTTVEIENAGNTKRISQDSQRWFRKVEAQFRIFWTVDIYSDDEGYFQDFRTD